MVFCSGECGVVSDPVEVFLFPSWVYFPVYNWGSPYSYPPKMDERDYNIRDFIQSEYGLGVSYIHEAGFHHHHLLDHPGPDNVVSQTRQ